MATIDRLRELVRGTGRSRQGAAGAPGAPVVPAVPPGLTTSDSTASRRATGASGVAGGGDADTDVADAAAAGAAGAIDAAAAGATAVGDLIGAAAAVAAAGVIGAETTASGSTSTSVSTSASASMSASTATSASAGVSAAIAAIPAIAAMDPARRDVGADIEASFGGLRELTYEPVDDEGQPIAGPRSMPSLAGASVLDTPLGSCIVVDHLFEFDRPHGRQLVRQGVASLRDVLDFCGQPLAACAGGHPGLLFLDLETTGLSGGAGTLAFLVGCGYFDDEGFRTRQFLLPAFAAERAVMHAVTALVGGAGCLVTYNGRTFDLPVMETRWMFHRVPPPWTALPHLDMLPLARRLWRERDEVARNGCRLVTLEQVLFGVVREGDVPGWEIPGRYFEYVRGGNAALLEPVLHHNRLDLLSLALLTARAMRLFREGAAGTYDPQECLAVGRELWRRRETARAVDCFRSTVEAPTASGAVRGEALHAWARLLRRERRFVEAADAWSRLAACRGARPVLLAEAREALAIHYEHRDRNLDKAHEWATGAYDTESPGSRREAVAHRLARLRRKIRVRAESGPRTALLLDELL